MVRAVHWLEHELRVVLSTYFEKFVAKFLPVTRSLVELWFCDVWDPNFLVAILFLDLGDLVHDEVGHKCSSRGPQRKPWPHQVREGKEINDE